VVALWAAYLIHAFSIEKVCRQFRAQRARAAANRVYSHNVRAKCETNRAQGWRRDCCRTCCAIISTAAAQSNTKQGDRVSPVRRRHHHRHNSRFRTSLLTLCNSLLGAYLKFVLGRVESLEARVASLLKHGEITSEAYLSAKRKLFTNAIQGSRVYRQSDFAFFRAAPLGPSSAIMECASHLSDVSDESEDEDDETTTTR
jgi:hypothetical protein